MDRISIYKYREITMGIPNYYPLISFEPVEGEYLELYMIIETDDPDYLYARFTWHAGIDPKRSFLRYPLRVNSKKGTAQELTAAIALAMVSFMSDAQIMLMVNPREDGPMMKGILDKLEEVGWVND